MRKLLIRGLITLSLVSILSGCSIVTKVEPAPPGTSLGTIFVQRNSNVHMSGLHDEIIAQLKGLGFSVASFDGERPAEAKNMLTYTANWRWDMAMYLVYFQATLLEENKILGRVEYDAKWGGGRPDKFGKTAEKLRPLLIELLQNVQKAKPVGPAIGTSSQG